MRFTSMTDKGGQEINKDSFARVCRGGVYCFVMADGGGIGGEQAAKTVTETVTEIFEKNPSAVRETAESCMEAAVSAVKELIKGDELLKDVTATAAMLITDGKKAVTAHIGDVRVYRLSKGLIEVITDDHTDVMEKYAKKEIEFQDIRKEKNPKLTRVISKSSKECAEVQDAVEIDNRTAFLICTDGFWKYIEEKNIEQAIKGTKSSKEWLGNMMRELEKNLPSDCGNITVATIIM